VKKSKLWLASVLLLAAGSWYGTSRTLATGSLHGGRRVELVAARLPGSGDPADTSPPDLSADGRFVVFVSAATDLVAGDTNGVFDVFVRDRVANTFERVSSASQPANTQGNNGSFGGGISADGRFVVFSSLAGNLVADDTNNVQDVFVRDRLNSTTERVSVSSAPANAQANGASSALRGISADGRFVVFSSSATNLVAGDTNNASDVFVRDRLNNTTERVSVTSAGGQVSLGGSEGSISGDGRLVVFTSTAPDLVAGDSNGVADIFLRDRQAATTTRISVSSTGAEANSASQAPEISDNGLFAVFSTRADNLVPDDTNGIADVFLRHLLPGITERLSVSSAGREAVQPGGGFGSVTPTIDADGSTIAFASFATNLVDGDTNDQADIFVRNRLTRTTTRVNVSALGVPGNVVSLRPGISANGRFIAFESFALNLITGRALPSTPNIFVAWRADPTPARIAVFRPTTREWFLRDDNGSPVVVPFGGPGDVPVPADYRGLGRAQVAVYRPANQTWFIRVDATTTAGVKLGQAPTDIPVPADYMGRGWAQPAVFRPSSGEWLIHQGFPDGSDGTFEWGIADDVPVPGDYDGDGRDDLAVFRPSTREWFIKGDRSSERAGGTFQFGGPNDVPVPGDYDGDGRTDLAVFRPATREWYLRNDDGSVRRVQFGAPGDIPVPADYLEAGRTEIAVFRPSLRAWFIRQELGAIRVDWGGPDDQPLPAPFQTPNP
jgi:Tol biopolymer transport system component